jgi:hypothetical protein
MTAPWPLLPLGGVIDQARFIAWEFEGAKFGHRVVDHPRDPGGRTLSGLTLRTYSREYRRLPEPTLAPVAEFDALTLDEVVDVLIELFAMRTGIWQIGDPALRLAVLDFAIHAGADDAVPALQRAIGVEADGQIGRQTLGALQRLVQPRAAAVIRHHRPLRQGGAARPRGAAAEHALFGRMVRQVPARAARHDGAPGPTRRRSGARAGRRRDARRVHAQQHGRGESHVVASTGTAAWTAPGSPNPALTPGQGAPDLTRGHLRHPLGYGPSVRLRGHEAARVRRLRHRLVDRAAYEVDHKIPRSLGGADDVLNLWPQPWAGEWGARQGSARSGSGRWSARTAERSAPRSAIRTELGRGVSAFRGAAGIEPAHPASPRSPSRAPADRLAPATARLTVRVERDADNRWLDVAIDGASYQRSSGRELAGRCAAAVSVHLRLHSDWHLHGVRDRHVNTRPPGGHLGPHGPRSGGGPVTMYVTPDSIQEPLYVITAVSNTQRFKSRWKLYRRFPATWKRPARSSSPSRPTSASGPTRSRTSRRRRVVALRARLRQAAPLRQGQRAGRALVQGEPAQHRPRAADAGLPDAKYIAWIDHDVVFARPNWVGETIHQLQHYAFLQMWSEAQDLGPTYETSKKHRGFMACYQDGIPWEPGLYGSEGTGGCPMNWHPGFAWAARREALDAVGGLIDFGILGAGDRHMACALVCRLEDSVAPGLHPEYIDRLAEWQFRAERNVRLNVGCMSGLLLHYWHGKKKDRRYMDRWQILVKHQYRPSTDIKPNSQGLYQLCDHGDIRSAQLRDDIRRYFSQRNEDSIDE